MEHTLSLGYHPAVGYHGCGLAFETGDHVIRRIACVVLIAATAAPLGAQISRGRQGGFAAGPEYWVGLSYGYMDGLTLNDGHSNSIWQFRYTSQLRATLEKTISGGVSVGASAGFSNPRLSYIGRSVGDPCGATCQADAQVTQYMAFVRSWWRTRIP